jgi:hypothetical protein
MGNAQMLGLPLELLRREVMRMSNELLLQIILAVIGISLTIYFGMKR